MTKRIIISILSIFLVLGGVARADVVSGDQGGGAPTGAAGGDLGSTYPNPTVTATHLSAALPVNQGGTGTTSTLTGIVRGSASAMTAAELSGDATTSGSNAVTLAKAPQFVGSATSAFATNTSRSLNVPAGTLNGDVQTVVLGFAAAPGVITPPAGWSAIPSCTDVNTGVTIATYSHTSSSEPASYNWSWTNSVSTALGAASFRNAGAITCVTKNAANGTVTTTAFTAGSSNDLVQIAATQNNGGILTFTAPPSFTNANFFLAGTLSGFSFLANGTAIGAQSFASGNATPWASVALDIASSGGGPSSAVTNNQSQLFVSAITPTQIYLPNGNAVWSSSSPGIWCLDTANQPWSCLQFSNGRSLILGTGATAVSIGAPVTTTTNAISSTTGTITTSTGLIGSTGGGHLSIKGGTAPTLTAGCNGAGSSVVATSNDTRGNFTSQTSAATTCTLHFNVAFGTAPFCHCWDANSSTTPVGCSVGTVNTTDAVFDFASTASRVWGYECIE